jgi:predicted peroxiredoxin
LIVITTGQEDGGGRATLGYALAVSLQAMGCDVAIYLNFHAAVWALVGTSQHIKIKGFDTLQTYMKIFEEGGGSLFVCSTCLETLPAMRERVGGHSLLREGATLAGVTTLAALLSERKTISF